MTNLTKPLTSDEWHVDLRHLAEGMEEQHNKLFFSMPREDFQNSIARLHREIPHMTSEKIVVEMIKIVAKVSAKGRDGHTRIELESTGFNAYPIRLYLFSDGLFVTDAQEPYRHAIGRKVIKIGNASVNDVYGAMDSLIPRDNSMTVKHNLPSFLVMHEILAGLGFAENAEIGQFLLEGDDGDVNLEMSPVPVKDYLEWASPFFPNKLPGRSDTLYLSRLTENFWLEHLENSNTLYIQYNAVRPQTQSGETIESFSKRLVELAASKKVSKTVVDFRHNGGGDNTTYGPLLAALRDNEYINQHGKLFVITGRVTFSAATNFTTELERNTNALFVGEPTGGSPNMYGDAYPPIILPNSNLDVRVSSLYWQKSFADDERLWHAPDIPVELSSHDYFDGCDPAMDAILSL